MFRWALFFFVLVLVSAVLAFTTVFTAAVAIAKLFFFGFLVLFLATLVAGFFVAGKISRKK